ncbi:hypothetical protein SAMN05444008_101411 [Cnuella takakiae]|uniref:Uncharacterized protein n=1 Tax=Cnuella takakiae TaxID=1302690 RepID=A0A1M4THH5_9BACT|nr:hypothetical protein [Cnuella takakiae]OLY90739.1 hypothetical protein BUE76_01615 [Cnuella takakiae]SHE43855.1 hypothetical protein SAMN05444008_101411 [Cnuella takakiae]
MPSLTLYLLWDDIQFDSGCLRIRPGRVQHILKPIPFKGAQASLNAIKQEYFVAKYNKPIKLVFKDSSLDKAASPAWAEINDLIEKAIEITRFATVPKTIAKKLTAPRKRSAASGDAPEISKEQQQQERPNYLKILARHQSEAYRLITIQEQYGSRLEESHIYRFITGTGRVLIVWENTNASRAAYLFIARPDSLQEQLTRIEAFIHTGDVQYKRSRFQKLKENKQLRSQLAYVGSVRHETVAQFETDIMTYIHRY